MFGKRSERIANRRRAEQLHGKIIRYVTERKNEEEIVLGRRGSIAVRGEELILLSSGEILFRSDIAKTKVSYLMSGDGVILTAENLVANGREQTVTAYFVDYMK